MHHSTREFGKVKGIHKIFIIFSQSKKREMVSFFERGRPEHRESGFRRSETRIIAAAYPPCSGVVKGRGTRCFGTAVGGLRPWWGRVHHGREDMARARCRLIRLWRSQLPLKGKRLLCKKPSACGEGSRVSGKGTSFLKIEKNEKKNGENRLTETNAFSII